MISVAEFEMINAIRIWSNVPEFSKKRSGLNSSGSGKSFGLCITAKSDANTREPFLINVPST